MNVFTYDASGKIQQFLSVPDGHEIITPPGHQWIEACGVSPEFIDRYRVDLDTCALVHQVIPPSYVTPYAIKTEWLRREQQPIDVNGILLDCDVLSETRMRNCLDNWDNLPVIEGQFEVVDGEAKVRWTLADNSKIWVTRPELQAVLSAMLIARAVRAARLFSVYQQLKGCTDLTVEALYADTTWV